jgi:hypothetical protein
VSATTLNPYLPAPAGIGADVLAHLDEQLASARRLLDAVLRQGAATRRQDVDAVLSCLTEIQGEMERRGRLEQDRTTLLVRAAGELGMAAHLVTLDALASLMAPAQGETARQHSAELRGLLAEIQREHTINRALMRQELAFLEHLTRLLGADDDAGSYGPGGTVGTGMHTPPAPSAHRVLDLKA